MAFLKEDEIISAQELPAMQENLRKAGPQAWGWMGGQGGGKLDGQCVNQISSHGMRPNTPKGILPWGGVWGHWRFRESTCPLPKMSASSLSRTTYLASHFAFLLCDQHCIFTPLAFFLICKHSLLFQILLLLKEQTCCLYLHSGHW